MFRFDLPIFKEITYFYFWYFVNIYIHLVSKVLETVWFIWYYYYFSIVKNKGGLSVKRKKTCKFMAEFALGDLKEPIIHKNRVLDLKVTLFGLSILFTQKKQS